MDTVVGQLEFDGMDNELVACTSNPLERFDHVINTSEGFGQILFPYFLGFRFGLYAAGIAPVTVWHEVFLRVHESVNHVTCTENTLGSHGVGKPLFFLGEGIPVMRCAVRVVQSLYYLYDTLKAAFHAHHS